MTKLPGAWATGTLRCWILLVLGSWCGASAADLFDRWTIDEGLPQNSVQTVLRARDGYLWLATFDGLARFDGLRFTVFNKSNTPGLLGNSIVHLHEDQEGGLWLALGNGLLARRRHGQFTTFGREHGLPGTVVFSIYGGEDGAPWLLCGDQPIHLKDRSVPGVQTLRFDGERFVPVPFSERMEALEDIWWNAREGSIWTQDASGLHQFLRGKKVTLGAKDGLPPGRVLAAHQDQFGTFWVMMGNFDLVRVHSGESTRIYDASAGMPRRLSLDPDYPRLLLVAEDRQGSIWMAGMGVWLGRLRGGAFEEFTSPNPSGARITGFHRDADGHLWFGTDSAGLMRVRDQVIQVYSTPEGMLSGNMYPVLEDRTGAIWAGAWSTGLSRVKDGGVTNYTVADGLPYPKVTSLYEDREGRIWVGTYGGLCFIENGQFHRAPDPLGRSGHVVSAIYQDPDGVFWFGTDFGVWRANGGDWRLLTTKDGLPADDIKAIIGAPQGGVWLATHGGLVRIQGEQVTSWTERDGLPSNHIRALYEDREGVLWIGTHDSGLGRLVGDRFSSITTREGLFDNGVFQILEDDLGYFWMSSNKGIHRASREQLMAVADRRRRSVSAQAYGKSDGMRNLECNGGRWPGGVKGRDGRLWFPTQDGLAVVDPKAVRVDPNPPTVILESCRLDREPVPTTGPVVVPPGTENFEIEYTGLAFVNANRVQFKYRLMGMDRTWVEAGTRRAAYYSHVPPGSYVFTVLAANRDGVWSERGPELRITVLPHWWQTRWFRVLALVSGGGMILGLFVRRIRQLERRRALQERFSRRLLESQEAERQRIAAELHDGLGQNLLIALHRAGRGARECGNLAEASERLREVEGLLQESVQEVRQVSQNLRPAYLDRVGLTQSLAAIVNKAAEASSIQFRSSLTPIDGLFPPADDIHIFRLVQEGVNNVLKHSGARTAEINARREGERVVLEVRDDGCGFDTEDHAHARGTTASLGLVGMAERIRLLGGELVLRSQRGEGTTVTMVLPVGRAAKGWRGAAAASSVPKGKSA